MIVFRVMEEPVETDSTGFFAFILKKKPATFQLISAT